MVGQTFAERLRWARQHAGFVSARQAALTHRWNENTYRAHEAGIRGAPNARVKVYARAFRVDYYWLLDGRGNAIAVAANDGGMSDVVPLGYGDQPVEHQAPIIGVILEGGKVKLAKDATTVAAIPTFLELRDDYAVLTVANHHDLWPFLPGWQLFFEPAGIDRCVGELCLVFTTEGDVFVKRLVRAGEDRFNLEHFNPIVATIENVDVAECYRLAGTSNPK